MTLDADLTTQLQRYLPREVLLRLPDAAALTDAIRRLNSLHQALSSFLPQYVADNERLLTEDAGELRPGTFMFSDVSGFTALSEQLQAAGGREGAEVLTQIINDFFAKMLDILAKSNGQLLKFAGDALLAFFPASQGQDEAPLAVRTGLRMQREMRAHFQPIQHPLLDDMLGEHNLELTMSIGVCRGRLFECVVGSDFQRDHIIQGDLPGDAMAAEEAGTRDDVIITARLRDELGDRFETRAVETDGFFQVIDSLGDDLADFEFVVPRRRRGQSSALFDFDEENLLHDLERQLERVERVARFVSAEVVNKLAFRGDHIESENRPATIIFTHFTGFADLLESWGADELPRIVSLVDRYYTLMQRIIANNGGSLNRSDPYQRGVKLLITFGAPVAHLDDPQRAVTAALEMNRQLALFNARLHDELPRKLRRDVYVTQRIGITQGPVFAGEAGWRSRREYTVMGDDVNLAARLMSKGDMGQIMISQRMWDRVNADFATDPLPPLVLKGKLQPVQTYLVKASLVSPTQMSPTSETPFVGRDLQLLQLTYALQQAKGPRRRQAFAIRGEIGVGKTRVCKQIVEEAERSHFQIAWANCQAQRTHDRSIWAAILYQLLQLDQAKSRYARHRLLRVRLRELELTDLEPLFAQMIFGAHGADSDDASPYETTETARIPVDGDDLNATLDWMMGTQITPAAPQPDHAETNDIPDASAAPGGAKPSIFEVAQERSSLGKSGIFGIAQRQMTDEESGTPDAPINEDALPFWQRIARQTSEPDSIARFLVTYTEQTPVLLVFDDAQRSTPQALTILEHVLKTMERGRLMVLVAHEPDDDFTLDLRRVVNLGNLDEALTEQLAARYLGVNHIGPRLAALLWQRTKGRPLFVESLLQLLRTDGSLNEDGSRAELDADTQADSLPENVRELLISQIDRLNDDTRAVLGAAAVLGDGFAIDALLSVSECASLLDLERMVGELIHAQLLELQAESLRYRFSHGLAQSTVYESLSRMARLKLHRLAADYWSAQEGDDTDQQVLRIAYHLVRAGMPMRGIERITAAADRAEAANQINRAIELFTHALELFPHDESLRLRLEKLRQRA